MASLPSLNRGLVASPSAGRAALARGALYCHSDGPGHGSEVRPPCSRPRCPTSLPHLKMRVPEAESKPQEPGGRAGRQGNMMPVPPHSHGGRQRRQAGSQVSGTQQSSRRQPCSVGFILCLGQGCVHAGARSLVAASAPTMLGGGTAVIKDGCTGAWLDAAFGCVALETEFRVMYVIFHVFVSSQFEQENQRLIGEMNNLFDEVRYVMQFLFELMAWFTTFPGTRTFTDFVARLSVAWGQMQPPEPCGGVREAAPIHCLPPTCERWLLQAAKELPGAAAPRRPVSDCKSPHRELIAPSGSFYGDSILR